MYRRLSNLRRLINEAFQLALSLPGYEASAGWTTYVHRSLPFHRSGRRQRDMRLPGRAILTVSPR